MCLFKRASAFTMVAGRASCNQIAPVMYPTLAARNYVIDCEPGSTLTTILAGEIIAPHDLAFVQFYMDAGSFDHPFEPNDGRTREFLRYSVDKTATIENQGSFAGHHQTESAPRVANIKRLKVSIQH
jgi:hypothetical protein